MRYKILIALTAISICSYAQTKDNKNNISIGFGTQSYKGDLGNTWFNFHEEWYGVLRLEYSRYLFSSIDVTVSSTSGDFGHCKDAEDPALWPEGTPVLNMHSRLTTGNIQLKYKFANGYLLKEESRIAPYLYAGAGIDNVQDIWTHNTRVNPGTYIAITGGAGVRFNFCEKISFTYNIGFGYFTNDKLDFGYGTHNSNPMYMQNTYSLGYNF